MKVVAKLVKASTRSGSWSHIYEEVSDIIDVALINRSNVLMNRGPYSSLAPNS